jgi:ParB/RepB/Spo0J family partition protein
MTQGPAPKITMLSVDSIIPDPAPLRGDEAALETLAESIKTLGLLQAITVHPDGRILCGRRRLAACRLAGLRKVPSMIRDCTPAEAELLEIDENFARVELTTLERSVQMARRRELYVAVEGESARGAEGFAVDTARRLGSSKRSVERLAQIGTNLDPAVAQLLAEHPVANSREKLLALARLAPDEQRAQAALILAGEQFGPGSAEDADDPPSGQGHTDPRSGRTDEADTGPGCNSLGSASGMGHSTGNTPHSTPSAPEIPPVHRAQPRSGPAGVFVSPFWPAFHPDDVASHRDRIAERAVCFVVAPVAKLRTALDTLAVLDFVPAEICAVEADAGAEPFVWPMGRHVAPAGVLVIGERGLIEGHSAADVSRSGAYLSPPVSPLPSRIAGADPTEAALHAIARSYPGLVVVDLLGPGVSTTSAAA